MIVVPSENPPGPRLFRPFAAAAALVAVLAALLALGGPATAQWPAPDPCDVPLHGSGVSVAIDQPLCGQGLPGQDVVRVGAFMDATDLVTAVELAIPFNQPAPPVPTQVAPLTDYLLQVGVGTAAAGGGLAGTCYYVAADWNGIGPDVAPVPLYSAPGCDPALATPTGNNVERRWPYKQLYNDPVRHYCNEIDFVVPTSLLQAGPLGGAPSAVHYGVLWSPLNGSLGTYFPPARTQTAGLGIDAVGDSPAGGSVSTFGLNTWVPLVPNLPYNLSHDIVGFDVTLRWTRAPDIYVEPGYGFWIQIRSLNPPYSIANPGPWSVLNPSAPVPMGPTDPEYSFPWQAPGYGTWEFIFDEDNCREQTGPLSGPGGGGGPGGPGLPPGPGGAGRPILRVVIEPEPVPIPLCDVAPLEPVAGFPVTASVAGGAGAFDWSAPGGEPATGTGATFSTTYASAGSYLVQATGPDGDVACVVDVEWPPVACLPDVQFIAPGDWAGFAAMGGDGQYAWVTDGYPSLGFEETMLSSFARVGSYEAVVASAGLPVAVCRIEVGLGGFLAGGPDGSGATRDADLDGVADNADNCPSVPNRDQADGDGDGTGDACAMLPDLAAVRLRDPGAAWLPPDQDQDGVADMADNCPAVPNRDQADIDHDFLGDLCDLDMDGDGVADKGLGTNAGDNCPEVPNAAQDDGDGDGVGTACSGPVGAGPARPAGALASAASAASPGGQASWMLLLAAVAGAAAFALRSRIVGLLLVLFSRLGGVDPARHPVRGRLLDLLQAESGLHFQELVRRSGSAAGVVTHHLRVLCSAGLVRSHRAGAFVQYFLPHPGPAPGPERLLLRSSVARRVLAAAATPGMTISALAEAVGASDRSVSYHVHRFAEHNLVDLRPDGNRIHVSLTPAGALLAADAGPHSL